MSENRYGEVPTSPVIMAACDSKYFIRFAPAFIASIAKNTLCNIHIHVINPDEEVFALACYLNSRVDRTVTYTFQDSDLSKYSDEQKRALYASLRFLVAPYILQHAGEILILDIDCMAMHDFGYPKDYDIGYFPREPLEGTVGWEQEGTKVAAGCVYFHKNAMNVCNAVCETLGGLELRWFNDQIALNHVFSQIPEELCWKYDWTFMDWEFKEGTTIWTGKGPRKYDNSIYVEKQNYYTDSMMYNEYENIILKPRLDIAFKMLGLTKANSVNEPIRNYWQLFVEKYRTMGYHVVESPRWMFNNTIEKLFTNSKKILIPHVEHHNWNGTHKSYYYMQTVFPWLFTIDSLGWAGGASYIDSFDPDAEYSGDAYYMMKEKLGDGKFGHLQSDKTPWHFIEKDNYIVVPLQLPHDETIKYHSDFSVEHFVTQLCHMANTWDGPQIIFKGHPVNFASMAPLKDIIEGGFDNVLYVADANFNDLVSNAQAMFVLNGGSGQEAMLHGIPVACFGRCDYAPAVINGDIDDPDKTWKDIQNDNWNARLEMYKRWYDWYINDVCINVEK
jgi:hypothetical protein